MKCNILEKDCPVSNLGMNIRNLVLKKELEILSSNINITLLLGTGACLRCGDLDTVPYLASLCFIFGLLMCKPWDSSCKLMHDSVQQNKIFLGITVHKLLITRCLLDG